MFTHVTSFNSGVYQNSIPRTRYEKLYAPVGSHFIRTKKNKITGSFQLRPKNSGAWAGELLQLSW
jgi:lipoate-protein ligase A